MLKTISWFCVKAFTVLAMLYLLWSLFFNSVETIFNVSIDTEYIEFKTVDNNNSRLILKDAFINNEENHYQEKYTGSLELNRNVNVSIERISLGGIEIEAICDGCKSVGRLYSEDEELDVKLGNSIYIFIDYSDTSAFHGITHLFRIDGEIKAGRSMGYEQLGESNPILRSGKVDLLGQSKLKSEYFYSNSVAVNMGDRIVFDERSSKSYGFVIINELAGMKATYRVMAKNMRIIRPGPRSINDGQSFAVSFIDGLYNDRFFKALSIAIGALIFGISLFTFIMDYKSFKKSEAPKAKKMKKSKKTKKSKNV